MLMLRAGGIGSELEMNGSSLTQLNIVYDGPLSEDTLQASLYGTSGPLRSDVLFDLPLPLSANMKMLKYVFQCSGVVMLFYPGKARADNYVKLKQNAELQLHCSDWHQGP
jgi:hypothetical protein